MLKAKVCPVNTWRGIQCTVSQIFTASQRAKLNPNRGGRISGRFFYCSSCEWESELAATRASGSLPDNHSSTSPPVPHLSRGFNSGEQSGAHVQAGQRVKVCPSTLLALLLHLSLWLAPGLEVTFCMVVTKPLICSGTALPKKQGQSRRPSAKFLYVFPLGSISFHPVTGLGGSEVLVSSE